MPAARTDKSHLGHHQRADQFLGHVLPPAPVSDAASRNRWIPDSQSVLTGTTSHQHYRPPHQPPGHDLVIDLNRPGTLRVLTSSGLGQQNASTRRCCSPIRRVSRLSVNTLACGGPGRPRLPRLGKRGLTPVGPRSPASKPVESANLVRLPEQCPQPSLLRTDCRSGKDVLAGFLLRFANRGGAGSE